jgi:uracil-DNA glycosylase
MKSSWDDTLAKAHSALSGEYREFLAQNKGYIPNRDRYLNAFKTLPKDKVRYILFGQDPYPREQSAGGYAFIDTNVKEIFAPKGLSKEVNRATSLRNFIKMALVARGDLSLEDTSQDAIAKIDKTPLINTIDELRYNFEKNGVLLLNTALVFTDKKSSTKHIKEWRGFIQVLLEELQDRDITLILFGSHAKELKKRFDLSSYKSIELQHPYNHTFISNKDALNLFGKMNLLEK